MNCYYKIQSYESDKRLHLGCQNSSLGRMRLTYRLAQCLAPCCTKATVLCKYTLPLNKLETFYKGFKAMIITRFIVQYAPRRGRDGSTFKPASSPPT